MSEALILIETRGRVGLLTLNRPKALNALNDALMNELGAALLAFDANDVDPGEAARVLISTTQLLLEEFFGSFAGGLFGFVYDSVHLNDVVNLCHFLLLNCYYTYIIANR